MGLRLLVIEDEDGIADFVVRGLREEGYTVERAADGPAGRHHLAGGPWDVVLLDWWLPGEDGLSLLRRFRSAGRTDPVLFLTARDAVSDRVRGLDGGADDYLCKPFAFDELLARVRALARRRIPEANPVVSHADVRVDLGTHRAERAGHRLDLTAKEYALLVFFLRHPGDVLTRTRIYEHVWDERYDGTSNTLEVHVMELRRKLEAHGPRLIHTLRHRGYRFGEEPGGMTLTTRLTVFALAGLAVVLAGFSVAIHEFVGYHLHRQLDDRLHGTLNVLTAATEVTDAGVEWEPAERRLSVGDGIAWLVTDPAGRVVDRGGASADFLEDTATRLQSSQSPRTRTEWLDERWQVRQAWIEPGRPIRPPTGPDKDRKFPALGLTVATSVAPVHDALRDLSLVLTGLSVGTWLIALLAGRAVCRWALRPVTRMAAEAREMDAGDLGRRLPVAQAGDELTALGEDFNALLGRVQEAFERQRRFTGDASHQLRTPLAALLGQVEVALRRDRSPDEYRQTLQSVHQQADRLRKIIESLLFLARADAEARLPDRERLDLGAWLPDHVRTAWGEHPRTADVRVEAGPAKANAHPVLLGELVNVLLDNACKYGPSGTPIVVRVGTNGDAVDLSVKDAGSGIAAADVDQVFEPFVRSDEARRRGVEGLGLGLSVARRIAEAHGGTLTVASRPGEGTTFTLRLPGVISLRSTTPSA